MSSEHHIVVLTGAGLSAESGLSTFRHPEGIWSKYDYRDVATPEGFAANPDLVHEFYNQRRRSLKSVKPNAAHLSLAKLESAYPGDVLIVTQNVDHLHEVAGSKNLIHMHGQLQKALCTSCNKSHEWKNDMSRESKCPACDTIGKMRPDVVWFGEMPYDMDRIVKKLSKCSMFLSVGTSGHVYPAAEFVKLARDVGAKTVELNLEPSQQATIFDESFLGPATSVVTSFVDRLIPSDDQH